MTQTNAVLNYLQTHKSGITSKKAFELFGCTRLASIVHRLRRNGYNVVTDSETVPTRWGRNTTVARYVLK